jgi:hypothetical protein
LKIFCQIALISSGTVANKEEAALVFDWGGGGGRESEDSEKESIAKYIYIQISIDIVVCIASNLQGQRQ